MKHKVHCSISCLKFVGKLITRNFILILFVLSVTSFTLLSLAMQNDRHWRMDSSNVALLTYASLENQNCSRLINGNTFNECNPVNSTTSNRRRRRWSERNLLKMMHARANVSLNRIRPSVDKTFYTNFSVAARNFRNVTNPNASSRKHYWSSYDTLSIRDVIDDVAAYDYSGVKSCSANTYLAVFVHMAIRTFHDVKVMNNIR